MRKKTLFFLFSILTVNSLSISQDIATQVREARNGFEREEKRREEREIQELLEKELLKKEKKLKPKLKDTGDKRYIINQIILEDAILLNDEIKEKITSKYVNKKIGLGDIYSLVGELTNEYIKKGYITTKITIPLDQSLADGKLKLKIIPGIIEKIDYNESGFRDRLKINMAFPIKKGDFLSLFELEQGIANLNNVVYNNAKMNLVAGSQMGKSVVRVENEWKFAGINMSYDNLGQKSTGRQKMNLSLITGDIIGNDSLSINGSKNLDGNTDEKYNRSISASYNIPYGFWNFGVSYNYSKYLTTVEGVVNSIKSKGDSALTTYKMSRVLGNVGPGKVTFESNLNLKGKRNFINGEKIEISSRKTSNLKNKLNYMGKFKGGSLYSDISQTIGLLNFGATEDINRSKEAPRSDYYKYNLNVRWLKPFFIQKQYLTYELALGMQYSKDRLYSADKFSLGDDVTVRGFESGVQGENGYYIRNQLTYSLGSLVLDEKSNVFTDMLRKSRIFAGIDYGMAMDKSNKMNSKYKYHEKLLGMEAGIKYVGDYLRGEVSYSKGLSSPKYIKKSDIVNLKMSIGL